MSKVDVFPAFPSAYGVSESEEKTKVAIEGRKKNIQFFLRVCETLNKNR